VKLAILVVYMVAAENERLLDLHLARIAQYTEVDYTIYGSINGLLPEFHAKLAEHPRVKICSFPSTLETNAEEHSYYLERLAAIAIEDGASHLLVLHVDSFPIKNGWIGQLASHLSESCVLVTTSKKGVPHKPTAGLFLTREFYLRYGPAFLLTQTDLESEPYQRFREAYPVVSWDSGMGYLFKAFAEGLSWYPLERTHKAGGSAIYGQLIFHLEGAYISKGVVDRKLNPGQKAVRGLMIALKHTILPFIPTKIIYNRSGWLRPILIRINRKLMLDSLHAEERRDLLTDPEAFVERLTEPGEPVMREGSTMRCGNFSFQATGFADLTLIEPRVFRDERGCFMEVYQREAFYQAGVRVDFVQDNLSKSGQGVLRGLHFQQKFPQAKLVRVVSGEIYDVVVDLRLESPTFRQWYAVVLSGENRKQLYIPAGFAHGFLVLSAEAEVHYKSSELYHPEDTRGIRWNDPLVAVDWLLDQVERLILSTQDASWPLLL